MDATLLDCPLCKKQVASTAKACPHCGHPFPERPVVYTPREITGHRLGIASVPVAILASFCWFSSVSTVGIVSLIALGLGIAGANLGKKKGIAITGIVIASLFLLVALVVEVIRLQPKEGPADWDRERARAQAERYMRTQQE